MKTISVQDDWPPLWREAYAYDQLEIYGATTQPGYSYAYDFRRAATLRLVREALAPGARVLDLAAAQGNFSLALAELGYRVTWNDLRAELEGYVRLKHEHGEIAFAPGNAFELGFHEEFDGVLITEVIEHVAHPDEFLRCVAGMVRPGGCVILTTPNGAYFRNPLPRFSACADPAQFESRQFRPNADGHIFLLWPEEIRQLAGQCGLETEVLLHFTTPLANGHLKTAPLLRVLPRGAVRAVDRLAQHLPRALRERLLVHTAARLHKPARSAAAPAAAQST